MNQYQLKRSMPGISDKNLKYSELISDSLGEVTKEEKACFVSILGYASDSLKSNNGLSGKEKSKKAMIHNSAIEFEKYKGVELRQICRSLGFDFEAVKQRYIKTINSL